MTLLFIVGVMLALFGLLDAVARIITSVRRANRVINQAPVIDLPTEAAIRRHPSNVRKLERRVKIR